MMLIRYIFCSLIFLTGCATQELRDEIRRLDRSISDVRKFQAEQSESISGLDSQLKTISGRVEELEYSQNKRLGSALTQLNQDVSSMKRRLPPPSIVPVDELEVDEVWARSLTGEVATMFLDGLQMIRDGRFNDAIPTLENAVSQTEGTDRAATCLFWVGVAYEGIDDQKGALRAYVELGSRYPKSQRAPAGFLRQGKVLARLGDTKSAELALKKLISDYPKSVEAAPARQMIRDLQS